MSLQARITALAQAIGMDIKNLTGGGALPQDLIPPDTTFVIAANRQLPIYGAISIDGVLDIQGKLVLT